VRADEVEILLLKPSEILVDRDHFTQRGFRVAHAQKIARDYSPALASAHVSAREDGYYAVDGQHTIAAALVAKKGEVPFPMRVHRGLSVADEARLFRELNAHKLGVSAYDRFAVGVTEGLPTCLDIVRILSSFGLTYGIGNGEGTVAAVDALVQIYESHVRGIKLPKREGKRTTGELPKGHLLSRTLTILTKAWGRDRNAFDGMLLKGIAALLYKHDSRVEGTRLAQLLAKYDSPTRAVGKIRALREAARITPQAAAVQYFEGVYNRKLTEEKKLK
jgi:hypothetical protein